MKAKSYCFLAALALIAAWLVTLPPSTELHPYRSPRAGGLVTMAVAVRRRRAVRHRHVLIVGASLWIAERVTA